MIDRRSFVRALIAGVVVAPLFALAQTPTGMRRIGLLAPGPPPDPDEKGEQAGWARMRELGWIEGRNLIVERRFVGARWDLLRPAAEELVRLKVDVIVTFGTEAAFAAKNATASIPIVITAGDPVGTGLVASLARPGGNITGYSILSPELATKRAAILHEVVPAARRIAVMVNPNNRLSVSLRQRAQEAYRSLGLEPIFIEATSMQDFLGAPAQAARQQAQALEIIDPPFPEVVGPLLQSAIDHRLPTMVQDRALLEAGGLIYFEVNVEDGSRRVAALIDKILRGAKPADIPIEQPTRFELLINLKTARALGITVPQSLLLRADEVIR